MSASDVFRAMAVLCERPASSTAAVVEALGLPPPAGEVVEARTFLFEVHPYASVHLGAEGMLGGEVRDRVAGFWLALGRRPPGEPDHLASLLGLYASLLDREEREPDPARGALLREARRALLWEHLLSWVVPFLHATRRVGTELQRAWAELLEDMLLAEARELEPWKGEPAHLREAAEALEADADPVRLALAPVRSGIVLTRSDLARLAGDLGLGVRIAERAYVLRTLAAQDPAGVGAGLAEEAGRWAAIHDGYRSVLGPVAAFWQDRAMAAAARFAWWSEAAAEVMAHGAASG